MTHADALSVLLTVDSPNCKLADIYDDSEEVRQALDVLAPGFEYPDISYLTLGELHKRYSRG